MTQRNTKLYENLNELNVKRDQCIALLAKMTRVAVAFSAGVDSTYLLALAGKTLGPKNVLAAIGVSPSLPNRELMEARQIARNLDVELVEATTSELENPHYAANPANRCYFCKQDLFMHIAEVAHSRGFSTILSGTNADDIGDFRPGLRAGDELGVRNPLMEANLTKAEIRELSRQMGLSTWNKPARACLASRVPYNQTITSQRLSRIEQAEQIIQDAGFRQVRVRDHDTVARIEVIPEDLECLLEMRKTIISSLKKLGYTYITMDLQGFRSGSSNEAQ